MSAANATTKTTPWQLARAMSKALPNPAAAVPPVAVQAGVGPGGHRPLREHGGAGLYQPLDLGIIGLAMARI